jgi:hypothetical protein
MSKILFDPRADYEVGTRVSFLYYGTRLFGRVKEVLYTLPLTYHVTQHNTGVVFEVKPDDDILYDDYVRPGT